MNDYFYNLLLLATIAAISASALNVLIGYTGVFNASQAVFFGIGAFASSQAAIHLSASIFVLVPVAIGTSMVVSVLLALPAARVVGDYFVVASLAFSVIGFTVFHNASELTGGAAGLIGIPPVTVFGRQLITSQDYLWLALVLLVLVLVFLRFLVRSPFGRSLTALRDDAVAAKAMGKNPFRLRVAAVIISAGISGLAGIVYAGYVGFVNADTFSPDASFLFVAMVILGGAGTLAGPVIGAAFITLFPALLDSTGIPAEYKGPSEQLLYGLALVVLMMIRPDGLAGIGESITRRLRRKGSSDADLPDAAPASEGGAR